MPHAIASLRPFLASTLAYARAHIYLSAIAGIIVLGGIYWGYTSLTSSATQTLYTLAKADTGTLITTVTGSGQVSNVQQLAVKPKASGDVLRVLVKNGDKVVQGQVLAYLDSTDAQSSLRDAQASLRSAQISLAKLQEPATALTLTQSQNNVANAQESEQTAEINLAKAYSDAYNDTTSLFLDMPDLMTSIKDIQTGSEATRGQSLQWNIDYYRSATVNWDPRATTYRDDAYTQLTAAQTAYDKALADFRATNAQSATSTIAEITGNSRLFAQQILTMLQTTNTFIQFYEDEVNAHNQTPNSAATSALSQLSGYIAKMNAHVSTLISDENTLITAQQSLASAKRSVTESQLSLQNVQDGTSALDLESAQLSVQQREDALQSAQQNLADYTIRAPISGMIAGLSIQRGDTAGSGSAVATIVSSQQTAELSLNEVDAAKLSVGQKATMTFDAIDGLTITGHVADLNPLGTVSQGVVTYSVVVAFDTQDARVKPGMTVNATIVTGVSSDGIVVPSAAIKQTTGGSKYVLVASLPASLASSTESSLSGIALESTPRQAAVTTGLTNDTETQVLTGLATGDWIVTKTTTGTVTTTKQSSSLLSLFGVRTPGSSSTRSSSGSSSKTTTSTANGSSGSASGSASPDAGGPPPGGF